MAALTPLAVYRRVSRGLFLPLSLVCLACFTSCERDDVANNRQIEGIKADLDEARRRISHTQNSLAAKDAELAAATAVLEKTKIGLADVEKALNERNADLRATKAELDELKKRDGIVFAEIAAAQALGQNTIALSRYQEFVNAYPKSPLIPHANNAINQLTEVQREVRRQVDQLDPQRRTREFSKTFNEGYMTLQELAPYLKKKTIAQVLALLGRPNQSYNQGTELGYAEKAINPVTGTRGMLVVSFEDGVVSTLRVEYAGRKMTP